ncbi:uncharacterized protein LOC111342611 isoform X2 [Stylophora pistillata]|uniref:uncharacterized protein LOC111342611 isoform X2 n=1 Tax=Stylophora pistillata TaxID=50429 RepID=UPI000C048094|nr:uncharacterized protein LOC111342611 isoform X2 [Stylophora pistillata]
MLKTLNEIYSPVLKLMKLFGSYYGHTDLKQLEHMAAGKHIFSKIYCGLMVSLIWLNVVMAFFGIFLSGSAYMFLMFALGQVLIGICGITSVIVLPLTLKRKSRFEKFIRSLLANVKFINLNGVKKKSRKTFFVSCLVFLTNIAFCCVCDQILGLTIACCGPWNWWFGFRVFALISLFTGSVGWLLTVLFFYVTCLILEECYDGLYKRMSSLPPLSEDFLSLKMEHHKLSEVVELADKMLSPFLLGIISIYMPLLCISYYNTFILTEGTDSITLAITSCWCLIAATFLLLVLYSASKVSEKIHSFQRILPRLPVSRSEEGKVGMLMFLLDLQGEPKGLSVGGLVVITKSMSLTDLCFFYTFFRLLG